MQCYLPTSSRAAKIFQALGGTRGQGNEGQGNGKHSPDPHSPDNTVLANLRVLGVNRVAQPFGCGSAALCLGVFASLRLGVNNPRHSAQMIRRAGNAGDNFLARFQIADADVGVVFQAHGVGDFQFLRAFELLV